MAIEAIKPFPRYERYKDSGVEWLEQIPAHWGTLKGKYIFNVVDERSKKGEEELLSVSEHTGVRLRSDVNVNMFMAESYVGYKICYPNDLVINSLWAWSRGLGISSYHGIVSTAYSVYRPHLLKTNPQFLNYLLRTQKYVTRYLIASKGIWISRLQLSDWNFLQIPILLPPLPEQTAIAQFLDHKTAQIDRAIAIKEAQIALLNERKQIMIQEAVTKGLDPTVPMKDSGVEWIGEITPAHWELLATKRVFYLASEASPKNHNYELLSVYTNIGVKPRKELEERGNKASTTDEYWIVKKGDIVVNKLLAWMGAVGYSAYSGVTSPAYDILRPVKTLEPKFYHYLFRTDAAKQEFRKNSKGIMDMRLRLYFSELGKIMIPFPETQEQREIVQFLDYKTVQIDRGVEKIKTQIQTLKEYKTTLINEAVTGKIKIN